MLCHILLSLFRYAHFAAHTLNIYPDNILENESASYYRGAIGLSVSGSGKLKHLYADGITFRLFVQFILIFNRHQKHAVGQAECGSA